jgi:hypothetical protein
MKRIVTCAVYVVALLLLGATVRAQGFPAVIGAWTGTVSYVSEESGYDGGPYSLNLTNQSGNLLMGFVVQPGGGDTNSMTGYLLASKYVVGAFDIAVSVSGTNNFPGYVATGLLRTNTQTIARFAVSIPGCENCENNNVSATGTLRKKP